MLLCHSLVSIPLYFNAFKYTLQFFQLNSVFHFCFLSDIISLYLYIIQLLTLLHAYNLVGKCSFGLLSCNNDKLHKIQVKIHNITKKKHSFKRRFLLLFFKFYSFFYIQHRHSSSRCHKT